jgi:hypothetical protein
MTGASDLIHCCNGTDIKYNEMFVNARSMPILTLANNIGFTLCLSTILILPNEPTGNKHNNVTKHERNE